MEEFVELKTGVGRTLDVEQAVQQRYSAASREREAALCCPVQYEPKYLEVLPRELLERDYGCGDPSRFVRAGETVLDLGSGCGKICYIASQIVGPRGRVWGVDLNDDMLNLARRHQPEISRRIGWDNVRFFKGKIQDLALNLERLETYLMTNPVQDATAWLAAQREAERLRRQEPMIGDDSVDVVLSNCVLNLVDLADRQRLFGELHRVLRPGGRAVISDIVSDQPVPQKLRDDPALWSGCVSGAFVEEEFLTAFEQAGFHGLEIVDRQQEPWATVAGIEFRSMTIRAFKAPARAGGESARTVIYRGPWKSVVDDGGRVLRRGVRTSLSEADFAFYRGEPYASHLYAMGTDAPCVGQDALAHACCGPTGGCTPSPNAAAKSQENLG